MDQFFSITLGEDAPDLGEIIEVKEGCLTNLINMLFERHILIKNDSKVSHSCTGGQHKIS